MDPKILIALLGFFSYEEQRAGSAPEYIDVHRTSWATGPSWSPGA